ncbi:hypothetical protein Tco_0604503 [Tanacetum coccineum]
MAIHHCDSQNQVHIFTNQDGHLFDLSARTQWPEKGLKSGFPTKIGLLSLETKGDDAALMSIDSKGTNIRVRQGAQFNIQRLAFKEGHEGFTQDVAEKSKLLS